VKIMEESGPPTTVTDSAGPERLRSGFRLQGAHAGPLPRTPLAKTMSDPALLRWRDEEKATVHTQRLLKNQSRHRRKSGWCQPG